MRKGMLVGLRRRLAGQTGFTITELAITIALFMGVMGIFLTTLDSVQRGLGRQTERSNMNDQARLAVEQLDREIRSGNVLYPPALETPADYSLRVYTQANGVSRCVQWRIEDQKLSRRSWRPGSPQLVSAWRIVATEVVNRELSVTAFQEDLDPALGGRTVKVTLVVDGDLQDDTTSPVRIETSLTGRNTSLGYAAICDPIPPEGDGDEDDEEDG